VWLSFADFDAEILRFAQDDKNNIAMRGKDLRSRCFFAVAQASGTPKTRTPIPL
jgi:hypothetical protein